MSTPKGMRAYFKNVRKQIMETRVATRRPGDPEFSDLEGMVKLVKEMKRAPFSEVVKYIKEAYEVSEADAKALVELALD